MKKIKNFTLRILGITFLSLGVFSCSNDNESLSTDKFEARTEQSISEVQRYYNNLKTIIIASEIYNYDVAKELEKEEVPLLDKLKKMNLENDETSRPMTFWDLKNKEIVKDFVEQYFDEEALTVSKKINDTKFIDETDRRTLINEFATDNKIIEEVMRDFNVIDSNSIITNKSLFF